MGDPFVELQAILAGVPMHAVPRPPALSRSCGPDLLIVPCAGPRRPAGPDELRDGNCEARIRAALDECCLDYPSHQDVLQRLQVVFANYDIAIMADHTEERLFVAARGTDRAMNPLTFPRDMSENALVVMGFGPERATWAVEEYRAMRQRFLGYASYGSGHSLGGAVMLHLAKCAEAELALRFARVDVFNMAVSPITRSLTALDHTELHAHRVPGDWASCALSDSNLGRCTLHTHQVKPHVRSRHALGHFLPDKARAAMQMPSPEFRATSLPDLSPTDSLQSDDFGAPMPVVERHRSLSLPLWAASIFSCVGVRSKSGPDTFGDRPIERQPTRLLGPANSAAGWRDAGVLSCVGCREKRHQLPTPDKPMPRELGCAGSRLAGGAQPSSESAQAAELGPTADAGALPLMAPAEVPVGAAGG